MSPEEAPERANDDRVSRIVLAILLALVTLGVYARVGGHEFVNYDDPSYVTKNPAVLDGLTAESVTWAFTESHSANWHPLTWMSHMLDVTLFGLDAGKHHLTSAVLHALNAVLCFLAFCALTRTLWPSVLVAALFALHPLRVESVAWVAERKDVLAGTFFFLTLWLYARYALRPTRGGYVAVAVALALGLMSKPMLVSLPMVLLLLDVWPLRRWTATATDEAPARSLTQLFVEKLPLVGLVVLSAIATVLAQQKGGTVGSLEALPPGVRLSNAVAAYGAYLWLTVWPVGLAVFYPHPALVPGNLSTGLYLPAVVSGVLLLVLTFLALRRLRTAPFLAVGWFWFLGMLVPVIGIVQVGSQAYADRYAYLPLVGVYVMVAFGLARLVEGRPQLAQRLLGGAAAIVVLLGFLTWRQIGHWQDDEHLFAHTLEVTEENYVAHNNLGLAYLKKKEPERAADEFSAASRINPVFFESRFNLALALEQMGRTDEARDLYRRCLRMRPNDRITQLKIGALMEAEDPGSARAHYEGLVQADPENAGAWVQLARLSLEAREPEAALRSAQKALDLDDTLIDAHLLMGNALEELGDPGSALEHFTEALQLDPDDAAVRARLGRALANTGRLEEAQRYLRRALDDDPDQVGPMVDLAKILLAQQDALTARTYLDRALERAPADADANDVLGFLHLQEGRYDEAERCFKTAIETDPTYGSAYNNLGYLYEEQGREREAVEMYRKLLEVDPRSPAAPLAARALAWILATTADESLVDGEEAERWAEIAIQNARNPTDPRLGEVMAAAKAAAEHFEDAVRMQAQVVEFTKDPALRQAAEERLRLYQAGRRYVRRS